MARVQPIFQNPFEAFNPLKRVDRYLASTARRFLKLDDGAEIDRRMDEALKKVGLSLAAVKGRFPHELSGGQLQRTAIARALMSNPCIIVADAPVSMVDASPRMSIVNLFKRLRDGFAFRSSTLPTISPPRLLRSAVLSIDDAGKGNLEPAARGHGGGCCPPRRGLAVPRGKRALGAARLKGGRG